MNASLERSFAEQQDRADGLASMRDAFRIPTRADGTEHTTTALSAADELAARRARLTG